jgi:adenosylhomocysteinase
MDIYRNKRREFLNVVASEFPSNNEFRLLVITHCLEDRPDFLRELKSSYHVTKVIPIPYSINEATRLELATEFDVDQLSLHQLTDANQLLQYTSDLIATDRQPLVVLEIGGYHAEIGNELKRRFPRRFVGCIESTESGHRAYMRNQLSIPVVSVARGSIKKLEYNLIGESLCFSLERLLRSIGIPLIGLPVGILGHGHVGSFLARSLARRRAQVMVYDSNPVARIAASAEGHTTPKRRDLLERARVVIGATGETSLRISDLNLLQDEAGLASASSKQVEFELGNAINSALQINSGVKKMTPENGNNIYLLNDGCPINFFDGAVVGPILSLVHAEIFVALRTMAQIRSSEGIHYVSNISRRRLCQIWEQLFM